MTNTETIQQVKTEGEFLQVVSFVLDRGDGKLEDYAVPIEAVKEIRALEEITHVPNTKSYVKGVMNLRGLIIPVIDIKSKLGFPHGTINKEEQRILVLEVDGALYGLLVDGVDQVMKLAVKDIDPPPQGSFEGEQFIQGIAKTNGRLIIFLNVSPLIGDSETEAPKNMMQETQSSEQTTQTDSTQETNSTPKSENTKPSESSSEVEDELPDEIKKLFDKEVITEKPV